MVARLIKDQEGLWLLCVDGTKLDVHTTELHALLFSFKSARSFSENSAKHSQPGTNFKKWNLDFFDMSTVPGETMAYVSDFLELVILEPSVFTPLLHIENNITDLLTTVEYAHLYNKSVEQVKVFCRNGRIPGAKKIGRDWVIPRNAPAPFDNRLK